MFDSVPYEWYACFVELQILFYRTARGDEPVAEYLKGLSLKERAKIEACLHVLGTTGRLDMPHGKKITGRKNLFEIRSGRHRILYGFYKGSFILLTAFMKKSQTTPRGEIELALRHLANYISLGG